MNDLTITAYSTALFSTWWFIDELNLLLDCGDGVSAGLLQKARKVKHVFITHPDRDHLTGLMQFHQLNGRAGLHFYYPADSGSFPALADFLSKFNPENAGDKWHPLVDGEEISIRSDVIVRGMNNNHVQNAGKLTKSLSYFVERVKRKLRPELQNLDGETIAAIRKEKGEDAITIQRRESILTYSGDTPLEKDGRWNKSKILIHEATFLTSAEIEPSDSRRNKHSTLDGVIEMVAQSEIEQLVLGHFSSRYSHAEIDHAIHAECKKNNLQIPVYRVLPGQRVVNVLGEPLRK